MRVVTRTLTGLAFGPALFFSCQALAGPMVCEDAPAGEKLKIEGFVREGLRVFQKALSTVSRIEAEPTLAGLTIVEAEMEAIRLGISTDAIPQIAAMYGAYIGEVIRSEAHACWTSEEELPEALRLGAPIVRATGPSGDGQFAMTVSTAWQHLENGAEDSPSFALRALLARLKDAD